MALYVKRKAKSAVGTRTVLRLRCPKPREVRVWITEGKVAGPTSEITLRAHK
jgi:hypothetical protein